MGKIFVIGLGPGNESDLTLRAAEALKSGRKTYLRTVFHPTISYLDRNSIEYESFDSFYEESEEFYDVYSSIAKKLIDESEKHGEINYCVPGHPMVAEMSVKLLAEADGKNGTEVEIIDGLSFIEPMIKAMNRDPVNGLKIIDGLDLSQFPDINTDNLITQVYDRDRASDLKLSLAEIYGDEYEVYVIRAAGMEDERKEKMPLYEIDRIDWYDYLTSIYIPKADEENKEIYNLNDLINIMAALRGENGCSWDRKQTHESLRRYLIEEAYEVADAIDSDDIDSIEEELGDVLLQIVFHSQIAAEEGYFNIWGVIKSISEKMVNRHPHVFDNSAYSSEDNWNEIKAKEKKFESHSERLTAVPKSLPALMRSQKVQKRAKDAGFDWEDYRGPMNKLYEEMDEIKKEIEENGDNISGELGDLLFSAVNLSRFFGIDPEKALYDSTEKFIKRFEKVEEEVKRQNKEIENMNLEELDRIWENIK